MRRISLKVGSGILSGNTSCATYQGPLLILIAALSWEHGGAFHAACHDGYSHDIAMAVNYRGDLCAVDLLCNESEKTIAEFICVFIRGILDCRVDDSRDDLFYIIVLFHNDCECVVCVWHYAVSDLFSVANFPARKDFGVFHRVLVSHQH